MLSYDILKTGNQLKPVAAATSPPEGMPRIQGMHIFICSIVEGLLC